MEMLAVCSRVLYDNDILNKMKEVDDLKKESNGFKKQLKPYKRPRVLYASVDEYLFHKKNALKIIKDGIDGCIRGDAFEYEQMYFQGLTTRQTDGVSYYIEKALTNLTNNKEWSSMTSFTITYGLTGFFAGLIESNIWSLLYNDLNAEQVANMVYKNIEWQLDSDPSPLHLDGIAQFLCPNCQKVVNWLPTPERCFDCEDKWKMERKATQIQRAYRRYRTQKKENQVVS